MCSCRRAMLLGLASLFVLVAAIIQGCAIDPVRKPPDTSQVTITVATTPATASVTVGLTQDFTASVAGDSTGRGVTWALAGSGCAGATCGTLTNVSPTSVTYTAPVAVPSPAVVVLTATSVADPTKSSSANITVVQDATIAVAVSPSSANVATNQIQTFTATVTNDPANKGVTWTLSGSGCSGPTCGALSNMTSTSVTYTAPVSAPSPAAVTLTATSVSDTTKSSSATITVVQNAAIAVAISPNAANVTTSQTQSFTATVTNDPANKGVTWTLSGSGCSGPTCGALSNATSTSVTYTAPASAPSPAAVTLTATSVSDTTKSSSAKITIVPAAVIAVAVSPGSASVTTSQTQSFTATVTNDPANKGVKWSLSGSGCSGPACGSLSDAASTSVTYTAPKSVPSPATVTLTATSVSDATKSSSATITIVAAIISVTVSPSTANVPTKHKQRFTASVQNDAANKGVQWSLSGSGCAGNDCGKLTQASPTSVTYMAPKSVPSPANITLTATSVSDSTKSSSAMITIVAGIAVNISPSSANVTTGQTQNFNATLTNDRSNSGVTWSLSGTGCAGAACGILSNVTPTSVTYTAPKSLPPNATVTITATSIADTSSTATAAVTIVSPIAVAVSPASANVTTGETQSFTAKVTNDFGNKGVTWTLSGSGCSGPTCGALSNITSTSVTYTAPASVPSPAAVTLTATSVSDTTKSSSAQITVLPAPLIVVAVSPDSANVTTGQTQNFTATVTNDPANKGVTWTLSGSGCSGATCGALSKASSTSVIYTAPVSAPSPAAVTLTATSASDRTKSSSVKITIVPAAITVAVSPGSANVTTSQTQNFTATVTNDPANKGVTWSLSGSGCSGATCGVLSNMTSTSVTYTAPASAPSPAAVTLTATSASDTTKSSSAKITVVQNAAIAVAMSPSSANVTTGQTQKFTATVTNDPANKGVSWSLSGSGCSGAACGVLSNTTSTSVTYTAPASVPSPAAVTLTATSVSDTTKSSSANITVVPQAAIVVAVSPTTAGVNTGGTRNFTATVTNDPANKGVTWSLSGSGCSGTACGSLSNATSTSVTYKAPASAPSPATVTLTATSVADTTKSSSATITISTNSGNITVSISPERGSVVAGENLMVTATTNDSAGVTWTVSPSGGSFNPQNSLSGAAVTFTASTTAGVYTITATSVTDGTASSSITVGVTDLTGVFTYHYDTSRDGVNSQEYALTPSNVNTSDFGKLFSCPTDAAIYAQPLWVPNVSIGGGKHNVVIVTTMHDSVYAFDADANPCVTYWHKTLIPSGETYGNYSDVNSYDIYPDIGILGTPVIDPNTGRIYLVAKTKSTSSGAYHQRLYALDLSNGSEAAGPVDLTSSITVPGTGDTGDASCPSITGSVPFCPLRENQRAGLALVNGTVYVAWGSHNDRQPFHGWILGFDAGTLARTATYNDSPNGREGGIWMSGGAPAVDSSNNMYVITGNGDYDGKTDFGDSLLKLSTADGLKQVDSFTPQDQGNLDGGNHDFGAGGALIVVNLPASARFPHLIVGGGKIGELYVLNRDNLGGYDQGSGGGDNVVQEFSMNGGILSTPVFWQDTMYLGSVNGPLQAFKLNTSTSTFNSVAASESNSSFGFPPPGMSISSSGETNGILWAIDATAYGTSDSGSRAAGPAVLHAYDATNLSRELWNSSMVASDAAGNAVKFTIPTVANGKVYLGTRGNDNTEGSGTVFGELDVYGLKP